MKSNINKCCVCGSSTKELTTCTCTLDTISKTYCTSCLMAGFEPYDDLVNFGWEFGRFTDSYKQKIIIPTLRLNNKTVDQFNADVMKKLEQSAHIDNISQKGQKIDV